MAFEVDAGEHGVLRSPDRLIDPVTGEVVLRLVPRFLERLHRPEQRGTYVPCDHDPDGPWGDSPLLRGVDPVDLVLRAGMTPRTSDGGLVFERAGDFEGRSWWRWIASALTPFGWDDHPVPQYRHGDGAIRDGRLRWLTLTPSCEGHDEGHELMESWLAHELGDPHEVREWERGYGHQPVPTWTYDWGEVWLYREPRDDAPELAIQWGPREP